MSEKNIIMTARIVSMILTPFYLPVVGVLAIFVFSYLSTFPWQYHGWTLIQLGQKERRMMPYAISILCYFGCFYIMNLLHLPHLITSVLVVALVIQVLCAIINVWWKISTHTAGIGGVLGGLIAFSVVLSFNPIWWLCLTIIASGVVGSSRIILRQHTLTQVTAGFFLGLVSAFVTIMII